MRFQERALILLVALVIPSVAMTGCSILGPTSIRGSRAAYNDAIITTNNQQVLAMIVRMRYGEPSGLLAVASVTANLSIQASAGAEFGVGSESNYKGNLTPLSTRLGYEENPTISYVPVQGEKFLRQMFSPVPIDLAVLLLGALGNSPQAMTLLLKSINGAQNPDFVTDASVAADPRFARIVGVLAQLNRANHITWAQEVGEPPTFALALSGEGAAYAQRVGELYGLLGFVAPRDLHQVLTLPIQHGIGKPAEAGIRMRTRSLWALFAIAAASVDVPEEHLESGLAQRLPPAGAVGQSIRIQRTKWRPKQVMIGTKHHGWWYSIDGTDAASKLTFRILEALMSVRMAEAAERSGTPVLTVPVSR